MAHVVDAADGSNETKGEEKFMDIIESEDAKFASISHSRALISPNDNEFELITDRMSMLMNEGRGECIFEVGLGTDPPPSNGEEAGSMAEDAEDASGLNQTDYEASVATLKSVADTLNSDCVLLRERILTGASGSGTDIPPEAKRTGQYLIRQRADSKVNLSQEIAIFID